MKLGHGYTIEEQLINTSNGGIQIDVFPSLLDPAFFRNQWLTLSLEKSPRQLDLKQDQKISMASRYVGLSADESTYGVTVMGSVGNGLHQRLFVNSSNLQNLFSRFGIAILMEA